MRLLLGLACSVAVASVALGVVTACGGNAFVAGPDAASPSDASADTAGAPSFCAIEGGSATFCDDFDGPPLTARWPDIQSTPTGATIEHDDSIFVSAPNSLEASVPASLGTATARGRVGKTFTSASSIAISLQVHLDSVALKPVGYGGTSFLLVQLGDNTLGLGANTVTVSYFEDQTADGGDINLVTGDLLQTQTVLGSWVPVTLDIDVKNATMIATVSGTSSGPVPVTIAAGAADAPEVFVGIQARNAASTLAAHYDNVLITVTP